MTSRENFVVVLVTAGSADEAVGIGRALVADRLAACVNVVPSVRSIYRWQGAVEEADEHLLLAKARAADVPAIEVRVRELHSYELPEILALPVAGGSAAYLAWLGQSTERGG
jgi:periplasmic divalent cation tolerance protein